MYQVLRQSYRLLFSLIFLAAILLPYLPSKTFAQAPQETWGDFINEPSISYGDLRSAQEHLEDERIVMSIFSGVECKEESYSITVSSSYSACWYDTGGHRTTEGGQGFVPAGAAKAGFMYNFETLLFPTKNDDVLIEQTAGYDRAWLRKGTALKATLSEDPEGFNPNFWIWDNPASLELKNEDGSPFYFHGDYLYAQATFSNNGRWMLLFDTTGYLIRIDLENLSIATYRVNSADEYFWPAMAISDNGRYIAVNDRISKFDILDTKNCTKSYTFIKIPSTESTCETRNLRDYALNYYNDLFLLLAEFYGDDILRIKGLDKKGNGQEIIVRAPNTRLGTNYIALGDSYSSGEGAYSYIPGTDDPDNRCHVSEESYPFKLGSWLGLDSTHSVACSGAKINNIAGGHTSNAAQNRKLPSDTSLGKWMPGYKWQIEHIKDNPVDIVTIGISGNDIGFGDKIKECLKPSKCFMSTYDRAGIALEINHQYDRLVSLFSSLRSQSIKKSPTARVYATGYPQVFDVSGSYNDRCGANVRLAYEEVSMANDLIAYLNNVIRQAAKRAGITYVSIEGSLGTHKLCGSSANKAMNGLTAGDGALPFYSGPIAIESYHPNHFGHTLMADAIRKRTDDFTTTMPAPDKTASAPDILKNPLVADAPDLPSGVRRFIFGGDISSEVVIKNSNQYLFLDGTYGLKIGSNAIVLYKSDPTVVGEFEVNSTGELEANYKIPESIEPGIHTLHVYGETAEGEDIDIYKTVYVAASAGDWDGDGISNTLEPCGVFEPAGIDSDGDGIDDGCDGNIGAKITENKDVKLLSIEHNKNNYKPEVMGEHSTVLSGDDTSELLELQEKISTDNTDLTGDDNNNIRVYIITTLTIFSLFLVRLALKREHA